MKKKYVVKMSYQITIEADSDADAIHTAQYSSIRGHDENVRHLEQRVVCVIEPPEVPQAKAADSGAGFTSVFASGAPTPPKVAEADEIPF